MLQYKHASCVVRSFWLYILEVLGNEVVFIIIFVSIYIRIKGANNLHLFNQIS